MTHHVMTGTVVAVPVSSLPDLLCWWAFPFGLPTLWALKDVSAVVLSTPTVPEFLDVDSMMAH